MNRFILCVELNRAYGNWQVGMIYDITVPQRDYSHIRKRTEDIKEEYENLYTMSYRPYAHAPNECRSFLWRLMHFQFLLIWLMRWVKIELFMLLYFQRSLNRHNSLTLRVLWIFIPYIGTISQSTIKRKLKLHATISSSEFVLYFHVLFINLYLSYFEQVELFFFVFSDMKLTEKTK